MRLYRSIALAFVTAVVVALPGFTWAQSKTPATVVNPKIPRLNDVSGSSDLGLVEKLRKGGYVIFFRHAATDWAQRDQSYADFENRSGQRNLSEVGKAQAQAIGKSFKALSIPVDSIFVSPMWRCRDTAELAFGTFEVKKALFGKVPQAQAPEAPPVESRTEYRAERIKMLSTAPTAGMNRILVGQQDPMIPIIPGLHRDELREGDALVIQPMGNDKYRVVAQVTPDDWARLAASSTAK
jgi:hypothetical protein